MKLKYQNDDAIFFRGDKIHSGPAFNGQFYVRFSLNLNCSKLPGAQHVANQGMFLYILTNDGAQRVTDRILSAGDRKEYAYTRMQCR